MATKGGTKGHCPSYEKMRSNLFNFLLFKLTFDPLLRTLEFIFQQLKLVCRSISLQQSIVEPLFFYIGHSRNSRSNELQSAADYLCHHRLGHYSTFPFTAEFRTKKYFSSC